MFSDGAAVLVQSTRRRSLGQQTRLLELRVETGGRGSIVDHIAKEVVTAGAVPTSTTDKGVIAETVHNTVAQGTLVVLHSERHT